MSKSISSVVGYIWKISHIKYLQTDEVILFRGHSSRVKEKLLPRLMRKSKYAEEENTILRDLIASQPAEFDSDKTALEQLAHVQHFGLPTRLLDATWNPLVALYFVVENKEDYATNGEVVVFKIKRDYVKYYDSDTVSCLANLAYLKKTEKDEIKRQLEKTRGNEKLSNLGRLVHFIRTEKPHFQNEIKPLDLQKILCVKPKQNNKRILAQNGAFLLFGLTDSLDANQISTERIQINRKAKNKILAQLDQLSINQSTMFPDIEKTAEYLLQKLQEGKAMPVLKI